jgi:protein-S-isoprenylcysteine O-methyltransferase Ste14
MNRVFFIRLACLYIPLATGTLIWLVKRPNEQERAGLLLASVWNAIALFAINLVATRHGWRNFSFRGASFVGVPVDLYLGWIVLWGVCAPLLCRRTNWLAVLAMFAAVDGVSMPRLTPVLVLGSHWWRGEGLALLIALLPSLLLARWTAQRERPYWRATMQFVLFSALLLWFLPSSIFALRETWWPALPPIWCGIWGQIIVLAGLPGVAAVHEFATRGRGTPLPYDPPAMLVTTGPYAYLANPMQMAAMTVLVVLGLCLRNAWIGLAGLVAHIYSSGIAAWDEHDDLALRHGDAWMEYRRYVRNWFPRWRPWHPDAATLYVSDSCEMCSEVKRWCAKRKATSLNIVAAERFVEPLNRITYVHADGTSEQGVIAFARALEHIHLGWAFVGWGMRLPVVHQVLQALVDASGGEPRTIAPYPGHRTVAGSPQRHGDAEEQMS